MKKSKSLKNIITASKEAVYEWYREFKQAVKKNFFTMKFLKQTAIFCLAIIWVCGIVLSFMSSTRTGWWTIAISFIVLMALLIAFFDPIFNTPFKEKITNFTLIIFGIGSYAIICYLLGFIIMKTINCFIQPIRPAFTEEILLFGFVGSFIIALIVWVIISEYNEGKAKDKWKNGVDYFVCWIKRLSLLILGCFIIYAIFYYLKPLLVS